MNILILGPQGSGKGTQARLLADKFKFYPFDNGLFLRELAKTNEVVRKTINSGNLVPDKEMSSYVAAFFDEKGIYDRIIFDGFPRTVSQYNFFKNWLSEKNIRLDIAFVITISEEESIRRLSARREDSKTHKIYNLITDPPPSTVDTKKLIQRDDDKPEAIRKRLSLYNELTIPLINELKKDVEVIEIKGERSIAEIHKDLIKAVEEREK